MLTLGWSLELGGRDAFIDELYVRRRAAGPRPRHARPDDRGGRRQRLGVRAVHLEVDPTNETARRLYQNIGFRLRERYHLMIKVL